MFACSYLVLHEIFERSRKKIEKRNILRSDILIIFGKALET